MREVTKIIANEFNLKKLKMDFMGYVLVKNEDYSYHHYLIARRDCQSLGLGEGYTYDNGVILNARTSHPELHLIEAKQRKSFDFITSEFLDMRIKRQLDIENLKNIREIILEFEYKFRNATDKKGKRLIKREYIEGRADIFALKR